MSLLTTSKLLPSRKYEAQKRSQLRSQKRKCIRAQIHLCPCRKSFLTSLALRMSNPKSFNACLSIPVFLRRHSVNIPTEGIIKLSYFHVVRTHRVMSVERASKHIVTIYQASAPVCSKAISVTSMQRGHGEPYSPTASNSPRSPPSHSV